MEERQTMQWLKERDKKNNVQNTTHLSCTYQKKEQLSHAVIYPRKNVPV